MPFPTSFTISAGGGGDGSSPGGGKGGSGGQGGGGGGGGGWKGGKSGASTSTDTATGAIAAGAVEAFAFTADDSGAEFSGGNGPGNNPLWPPFSPGFAGVPDAPGAPSWLTSAETESGLFLVLDDSDGDGVLSLTEDAFWGL